MKTAFWSDGPFACEQGLHEHYEPLLKVLRERITESVDIEEQSKLGTELSKTKAEYRERRRAIHRLLF